MGAFIHLIFQYPNAYTPIRGQISHPRRDSSTAYLLAADFRLQISYGRQCVLESSRFLLAFFSEYLLAITALFPIGLGQVSNLALLSLAMIIT